MKNHIRNLLFLQMRGEGSLYVLFIMVIIILGANFITGGLRPEFRADLTKQYTTTPDNNAKNNAAIQLQVLRSKEKPQERDRNNNDNRSDPARPTQTPTACSQASISFLVDVSGSMLAEGKIDSLKSALSAFTRSLPDETVFALYSFASEPRLLVAADTYGEVKQQVASQISNLNPSGATYMRDGLTFVNQRLTQTKNRFPNYNHALVFVSDGVPELNQRGPNDVCLSPERCYSPQQDPTTNPNVATQIKDNGIKIYSVGVFTEQDVAINNKLEEILANVASDPDGTYYRKTLNADGLNNIFNQIRTNLCK